MNIIREKPKMFGFPVKTFPQGIEEAFDSIRKKLLQ